MGNVAREALAGEDVIQDDKSAQIFLRLPAKERGDPQDCPARRLLLRPIGLDLRDIVFWTMALVEWVVDDYLPIIAAGLQGFVCQFPDIRDQDFTRALCGPPLEVVPDEQSDLPLESRVGQTGAP